MNALTLSATRRRDQVVILTGPAIGASLQTLRVKSDRFSCGFKFFAYLCNAFQSPRAEMLATFAGKNFALAESYSVPTPVWSVNAPTARDEWNATGKRSRFSVFSRDNLLFV